MLSFSSLFSYFPGSGMIGLISPGITGGRGRPRFGLIGDAVYTGNGVLNIVPAQEQVIQHGPAVFRVLLCGHDFSHDGPQIGARNLEAGYNDPFRLKLSFHVVSSLFSYFPGSGMILSEHSSPLCRMTLQAPKWTQALQYHSCGILARISRILFAVTASRLSNSVCSVIVLSHLSPT